MSILKNASDGDQAHCCILIRLETVAKRGGRGIFAYGEKMTKIFFSPFVPSFVIFFAT